MSEPRIDQINVVVPDAGAAAAFLAELGVAIPELPSSWAEWAPHHRSIPAETSTHAGHDLAEPTFGIDLDSSAFARWWGGLPPGFAGMVLNVRFDDRREVDQRHEQALGLGARSLKAPHDAFWGSRFALVEGPGPLLVGLMSVPDQSHRADPPDLSDFT